MMSLSARFEEALVFAVRLHAGQTRKGTDTPYIAHLLAVASIVIEHGASEDEAIAALLHDAAEDQGGKATLEKVRDRFGERVAEIVAGCTDSWTTPRPPWRKRKEAYIAHLRGASASVRLVSAADKLHNARTILADYRALGESLWNRFNGGREGTLWYYRSLIDVLQDTGPAPIVDASTIDASIVEELDRVVSEIERLASAGGI
jgi:(p)ppGpp synthase/HD superfamily hydrolase